MKRLRFILAFAAIVAVFVPTARATHDSPNPGADIIGAEPILDETANTLDVTVFFEGNTIRGLTYTLIVYDEASGSATVATLTQGGSGTSSIAFNDIPMEEFTCDDPNTPDVDESSGDRSVYLVATATAGAHTFDVAPGGANRLEVDFCFPPGQLGMD